ncbi:hypothetical protein PAPYR_9380 [Paratrimastix pyriformis]|uniref:Replication factor A protein 3 n=1 Tax=Paratrimastix pyriformis TaxID=342808 RepID=A0ABQ8UFP8_9EUKA|nr:hypothetical protein PAPYR_9380 [Paratrimastix pyriformis]
MADQDITPRVNHQCLPMYKNRTVRLVGKVLDQEPETDSERKNMTLLTSDNQNVIIHRERSNPKVESEFVEVIGNVEEDLSVSEVLCIQFGRGPFDMKLYDEFVQLSNGPFQQLFM